MVCSKRQLLESTRIASFLLPSVLGVAILFGMPFIEMVRRSFFDITGSTFVGLENYHAVLSNRAFSLAAANTALFLVVCVPLLLLLSFAAAYFLRRTTVFRRFAKASLLVPLAIPVAAAALMVRLTFDANGFLNGVLTSIGIAPVSWLEGTAAFWVLVGNYVWRNLGYCVVLWLAAFSCVPERLLEAGRLDGASEWHVFRKIVVPLLAPSFFVVAIIAVVNAFRIYREAYLVAGSYPSESMFLIPHLFNNWFAELSVDKLAAGGVLLALAVSVFVLVLFVLWKAKGKSR